LFVRGETEAGKVVFQFATDINEPQVSDETVNNIHFFRAENQASNHDNNMDEMALPTAPAREEVEPAINQKGLVSLNREELENLQKFMLYNRDLLLKWDSRDTSNPPPTPKQKERLLSAIKEILKIEPGTHIRIYNENGDVEITALKSDNVMMNSSRVTQK
jgi:hypothetical protein